MTEMLILLPLGLIILTFIVRKWWIAVPAMLSLSIYWLLGAVFILFAVESHRLVYGLCWTVTLTGFSLFVLRIAVRRRKLVFAGLLLAAVLPVAIGVLQSYDWWTKYRFDKLENRVDWSEFQPFSETNRLVCVTADERYVYTKDAPIPEIECAYALYPIGAAAVQAVCPETEFKSWSVRPCSSPDAYGMALIDSSRFAALALAPSDEQLADALKKGVSYELTPVAQDAFVFFVPFTNPADSLTSEQVRGIYSGRIKSWRELGVDLDAKLVPYQRNKNSGSQTALERLMGDEPIMPPLKEDHLAGMGGIISEAADYRNKPGALGFSFRYYMEELVKEQKVKILKIDGVAPTVENIRSHKYPFVETSYLVTAGGRSGNIRKLADFLVSPTGRDLVERTGYVAPPTDY